MEQNDTGEPKGASENSNDGGGGRTYTDEDLNRILARDRKNLEQELAERPTVGQVDELKQQLSQLQDERDLAGKSEIEKIQHAHERALEKMGMKLQQAEAQIKEHNQSAESAREALTQYRLANAFSSALAKAEVYGRGAGDALKVLLSEIKDVDTDDPEKIRASYGGDLIDEAPEAIARKFLEDRPHFAAAKGGGAGTMPPTGQPHGKNLEDMTMDEIWEDAGPDPSLQR